ncbi:hypothetical protein [Paraliobacillus salinarum]|uniref:hypothetical protein n=1 Tax=Paraliobacillus salinarum TaxID=1158996 RepID=UPI0015F3E970|nr:hypothetical protein [Paraliobacillus salinarum]
MDESSDYEDFQGQQILEKEAAINELENFHFDDKEYYLVYQKENQPAQRQMKFNKVEKKSKNTFAIAMQTEDKVNSIRCYYGEEILISRDEIIQLIIIKPGSDEFVVYTD